MKEYKDIELKTSKNLDEGYGQWKITISKNSWKDILTSAKKSVMEELQVPGFRKGKVPENIAKQHISEGAILNKAGSKATQIAYKYGLDQKDLDVKLTTQPEVVINELDNEHCQIDFNFDLPKEVKIKKYFDYDIEKQVPSVTKEEINEQLKMLKDRFAVYETKEKGALENGETAVFDFEGTVEGKEFLGNKAKDFELEIGSKRFIAGFEEQMIGMKPEEEKTIQVTFPEDYHVDNLKGKLADFKINLKSIKVKKVSEDNEELVKDVNIPEVKTYDELLKHIEQQVILSKTKQFKEIFMEQLLNEIANNSTIIVPRSAILNESERLFNDFKQQLKQQNMDLKTYEELSGIKEAEVKKEAFKEALTKLKSFLIIEEVFKKEKIEVSQEEIDQYLTNFAKQFNMTLEQIKTSIKDTSFVQKNIKSNKVLDLLWEKNGKKVKQTTPKSKEEKK